MTDEYISREAAVKDFEANNARNPRWTPQRVKTLLLRQPAADVAEVVHGRWERMRESATTWRCSACDVMVGAFLAGCSHYCYCCGARMDGGNRKEQK